MSTATYAVAGSKCDASIANTSARAGKGRLGTDTSSQDLPAFRVTLIKPLFVPIQMRPGVTVESDIDMIAPPPVPGGEFGGGGGASARIARSGLIAVQCVPASTVDHTDWNPAMSIFLFHGAKPIGWSLVVRSRRDGSGAGLTLIHSSLG